MKPLLILSLSASLLSIILPRADAQVYSPSQTYNQSNGNMQNWRNRRDLYRKYGIKRAPDESQAGYGRRIMESGRATTKFTPRPFPIANYMKTVWNGDAATRARNLAEWRAQSAIWNAEVKARRARRSDMADMYALAIVTSYEAHTGKRVSNVGFAQQARELTPFFAKMSFYQGYNALGKQEFYESAMVRASNALRLRRAGDVTKAKAAGAEFLNEWATGKLPGALQALARYEVS